MKLIRYIPSAATPTSPPSRGAWIEIILYADDPQGLLVAPLAGGVD